MPTDKDVREEQYVAVAAFLEERNLVLEVFHEALDLMAYLETYWQSQRENGERAPQTIMALGKLFSEVHRVHKTQLRKRILEVREKLHKAEHRFTRR